MFVKINHAYLKTPATTLMKSRAIRWLFPLSLTFITTLLAGNLAAYFR